MFIKPKIKTLNTVFAFALPLMLVFGAISVPSDVKASFFSSFWGNDALAQTNPNTSPNTTPPYGGNSQTMGLLQATVSSASALQDKGGQDSDTNPNSSMNIVSDNSLQPATGPLGVSDGKDVPDPSLSLQDQTSVYVVRQGDNLAAIAKMFGVSVNTILWENDMKKGDKLGEGDVLFILPVSGLQHTVAKGQTLQSIAKIYKADISEIIRHNDVTLDSALAVGDILIIPNGEKSVENDKPIKDLGASIAKDKKYYETHPTKNLSGYYINPVPGYKKSQGIHDKNGVDLAIAKGTPIHAAAEGRVTLARGGYNGGFGNLIVISHPNGTETLYAHLSKISTATGAQVSQGEVIGNVGSTGRSTGPHLHFEVHGARNPGTDGAWKY